MKYFMNQPPSLIKFRKKIFEKSATEFYKISFQLFEKSVVESDKNAVANSDTI